MNANPMYAFYSVIIHNHTLIKDKKGFVVQEEENYGAKWIPGFLKDGLTTISYMVGTINKKFG